MLLLGFIPLGWQNIVIEKPLPDKAWALRDNGSGGMVSVWDHHIFVAPEGSGTRYTDEVRVEAGLLTPFVVLFTHLLYRYRQYRWRRLVRNGFDYDR